MFIQDMGELTAVLVLKERALLKDNVVVSDAEPKYLIVVRPAPPPSQKKSCSGTVLALDFLVLTYAPCNFTFRCMLEMKCFGNGLAMWVQMVSVQSLQLTLWDEQHSLVLDTTLSISRHCCFLSLPTLGFRQLTCSLHLGYCEG